MRRNWQAGDRVVIFDPDNDQLDTCTATVIACNDYHVDVVTDTNVAARVQLGRLSRLVPPDEADRARANLKAAGYVLEPPTHGKSWWWRRDGHSYSVRPPTPDNPEPINAGIADVFGHDLPPCHVCGRPVEMGYANDPERAKNNECFHCHFWLQVANDDPDTRVVLDDGRAYTIAPDSNYEPRGFGGQRFVITWLDGRSDTVTRNLWYRGVVPEVVRHLLPVNARMAD